MHKIQKDILNLANDKNLAKMSLREISNAVGEGDAPQKIKHHLEQLEKKGLLRILKEKGETIKLQGGKSLNSNLIAIPILGSANCGDATIIAEDKIEGYLRVSPKIFNRSKNVFAIKAIGDSMNMAKIGKDQDSINDGDYVIVDHSIQEPKDGDYIVSVIDGLANIKKYNFRDNTIILKSESKKDYPPIYIHEDDIGNYTVAGRVVKVIKS